MRFFALALLAAAAGCGTDAADEGFLIGLVVSTTGPHAPRGVAQLEAAALAAEEVNASGGVLGQDLRLVHRDDGGDAARARRVTSGLLDEVEPVFLGAVDSTLTDVLSDTIGTAGLVVSASATHAIADDLVLCTCPSDDAQAELMAERAIARGLRRIAVIHPNEATVWERAFVPAIDAAGGTVTVLKTYTEGRSSYASLLASVFDTNPDAIVLDANAVDGATIVSDYVNQLSGSPVFWLFAASLETNAFVTAAQGTFDFPHEGLGPASGSTAAHDRFVAMHGERYDRPPPPGSYAANMYDAVHLVALAAERVGGADDPNAVAAAIVELGEAGFDGASGPVSFGTGGTVTGGAYDVWVVRNGQITILEERVSPSAR